MYKLLLFKNRVLLQQALTHRSYVHENPQIREHNERLEFLGDAILNYLSGSYLYNRYPNKAEDELTRQRSALVDEKQLAQFALTIGLDKKLLLGKGAKRDGGLKNPNLLSCAFEAVVAAYYLDNNCDVEVVRDAIEPMFRSVPESTFKRRSNVDSKNRFQEWVQHNVDQHPPKYITNQTGGSCHSPEFIAEVLVHGKVYGVGQGKSKKEAEKAAAEDALKKVQVN